MQKMYIGNKIQKLRELKNYTQEYMAQRLSISKTGYGKIERDETEITIKRLVEIAEVLETSIAKILDFNDQIYFKDNQIENAFAVKNTFYNKCSNENYIEHLQKEIAYLREQNNQLLALLQKDSK